MEGHETDCLYEDLPEFSDTSPSSGDTNIISPSSSDTNIISPSSSDTNLLSPSSSDANLTSPSSSYICVISPPSFSEATSAETPLKSDASVQVDERVSAKECSCGKSVQWAWDSDSKSDYVEIVNSNMEVRFHRNYSNGTAVVRCTEPMANHQYYWELKMTYPVYGTDVMVGVGTSEARLKHLQDRFVSFLGMDNKTWGFSYTGLFHHNGQRRCYATSFGQGSIIGVHLDLWKGTLSFYKDKKHLGIACSGLKGKTLYAMAASTAARSGMRIIHSCSFPSSLQFLCCSKLRELIPDDKNVLDVIDIPPGLKHFLQNKLNWLLEKRNFEGTNKCCVVEEKNSDQDIVDESLMGNVLNFTQPHDHFNLSSQFVLLGSFLFSNHSRFQRTIRNLSSEDGEDSPESESKRQRCSYNSD